MWLFNKVFFLAYSVHKLKSLKADLMCRPSYSGIGILDPVKTAFPQFTVSNEATSYLSEVIFQGTQLDLNIHESQREDALKKKLELEKNMKDESLALIDSFPDPVRRCIKRKIEFQCSGWLSVIPVEGNQFDLSPHEFRDAIAL